MGSGCGCDPQWGASPLPLGVGAAPAAGGRGARPRGGGPRPAAEWGPRPRGRRPRCAASCGGPRGRGPFPQPPATPRDPGGGRNPVPRTRGSGRPHHAPTLHTGSRVQYHLNDPVHQPQLSLPPTRDPERRSHRTSSLNPPVGVGHFRSRTGGNGGGEGHTTLMESRSQPPDRPRGIPGEDPNRSPHTRAKRRAPRQRKGVRTDQVHLRAITPHNLPGWTLPLETSEKHSNFQTRASFRSVRRTSRNWRECRTSVRLRL